MFFENESTARQRREDELHRAQLDLIWKQMKDIGNGYKEGITKGREDMRDECVKALEVLDNGCDKYAYIGIIRQLGKEKG